MCLKKNKNYIKVTLKMLKELKLNHYQMKSTSLSHVVTKFLKYLFFKFATLHEFNKCTGRSFDFKRKYKRFNY